jgi:hypothetical protein
MTLKTIYLKPYRMFSVVGLISFLVALYYYFFDPESSFDISVGTYIELPSFAAWLVLSAYVFFLAIIYYVAEKGKLHTRTWLVKTHFIVVLLFLLLFFVFSSFNTPFVRDLVAGTPFLTLMVVYGTLFLVDLIFFIGGIALLLVNLFTLKKN